MNSASTAKVPQVARFQPWYESPNANASAGPKIAGETLVLALSSLVLADIDDSQNAQFKNRTASIGEDDVYAPPLWVCANPRQGTHRCSERVRPIDAIWKFGNGDLRTHCRQSVRCDWGQFDIQPTGDWHVVSARTSGSSVDGTCNQSGRDSSPFWSFRGLAEPSVG